jgi:transcriptional regulator with XRE-family HTH domain
MEIAMSETTFGRVLRELRTAKGLTQMQLAELSGLHRQIIASLELGTNEPHWPSAVKLAKALGVSVGVFTGEKPIPTPRTRPPKRKK